eukprot:CAMPEP_0196774718 /NCGR_PEP_ID=MMETSP1104-20130614/3579_1 /TAXON_ID=33652 /ORGANISM="Cafeteria sp., Strain Caron Lab Isolate" /LENGTH=465 /DNA_ID=CAMNT_0042144881 /DNA_START=136 /DNA_END=1533 /DNA_ORIENTATION=+
MPGMTMDFFAQKHNANGTAIHCEDYHHNNMPEACKKGNSDAVFINGLSSAVSGFLTFLMSPLLGSLSDSFGRKPFLVIAQATSLLPSIALLLFDKRVWSLYPFFFFNGLSGAVSSISLVMAYIADLASPENRTGAFGLVLAVFSFALLGTPVMGAFLPRSSVFMVATGAGVVCVVFLVLFVPESLPDRLRKPFVPKELNPLRDVAILTETRLFRRLSVVVMLDNMVMQGVVAILAYYLQQTLDFDRTKLSGLLLAFGVSGFISNGVLLKWLTSITTEKRIIVMGVLSSTVEKLVYLVVNRAWIAYVNIAVFGGFASISFAAISSVKSNNVDDSTQGQIQGALYGIKSLAAALGPLLFSFVFRSFDGEHYGLPSFVQAPMVLGAFLEGIAALVAMTIPESCRAEDMMTPRPERDGLRKGLVGYASVDDEEDDLDGSSPVPVLRRLRTLPGSTGGPEDVEAKDGFSV